MDGVQALQGICAWKQLHAPARILLVNEHPGSRSCAPGHPISLRVYGISCPCLTSTHVFYSYLPTLPRLDAGVLTPRSIHELVHSEGTAR